VRFSLAFPTELKYRAYLAMQGDSEAQKLLGDCYLNGLRGLNVSTREAFRWFEMAADNDNVAAQLTLADLYHTGYNGKFERSEVMAFKYYSLAAHNGDKDAQYKVAVRELCLPPKQRNLPKALRFLDRSARQLHTQAMACLGTILLEGKLCEKDVDQGISLLKEAALRDDRVAFHNLAVAYKLGIGVDQDFEKSIAYAELASFVEIGEIRNHLLVYPGLVHYA
jgi:TPR repeat protein